METRELYRNYVTTHFSEGGKLGEEYLDTQLRYFQHNYLKWLPSDRASRIVDLGSGLGHFLHFLRRAGYQNVLGVDVAAECVVHARKVGLQVIESDLFDYLEKTREQADVFILNDVLEHQTKEQMWRLLKLIYERLRPGGRLIVKVPNMAHPLMGSDSRYLDITHEAAFNQSSLLQVLLLSGFEQVKIYEPDIYVFDGLVNRVARSAAGFLNRIFFLLFKLYGRTETTMFGKNIVGVAQKQP